MKGFLHYLMHVARQAVAMTLGALGLIGEASRVVFDGYPIPRWVDISLLFAGVLWGGYRAYREKPGLEIHASVGATPKSAFYSRLSTLPRRLAMGEVIIGYEVKEDLRFTDEEFSAIDEWMQSLRPDSIPSRSDLSFLRRQVQANHVLRWQAQADLPGPIVRVDQVVEVHAMKDGSAADLQDLYNFWAAVVNELPRLSLALGAQPIRAAFALQPYPSDQKAVIDLWFGQLPAAETTGAAGNVPPWQEVFDPVDNLADLTAEASKRLLRHYGYRRTDKTVQALISRPNPRPVV